MKYSNVTDNEERNLKIEILATQTTSEKNDVFYYSCFSIAYLISLGSPPFLSKIKFFIGSLYFSGGDVFDLFAPLMLIPLLWGTYKRAINIPNKKKSKSLSLFLKINIIMFIFGHSMHLAANGIGNVLTFVEQRGDVYPHEIAVLVDFYDEFLGHLFVIIAILNIQTSYLYIAHQNQTFLKSSKIQPKTIGLVNMFIIFLAAFLLGFGNWFGIVEANFSHYCLPYCISLFFLCLLYLDVKSNVLGLYFFTSILVTTSLLCWWGWLHNGEFPEFSELGLLGPIKNRTILVI